MSIAVHILTLLAFIKNHHGEVTRIDQERGGGVVEARIHGRNFMFLCQPDGGTEIVPYELLTESREMNDVFKAVMARIHPETVGLEGGTIPGGAPSVN